MTEPVYILTARMDAASFAWLDALRRAHFPQARNVLSAHLTMFHRLSPPQVAILQTVALPAQPIPLQFERVIFLGGGNAIRVQAPDLERLRDDMKRGISHGLSRQDDQRWMPHVTVQNKVTPEAARALNAELTRDFRVRTGSIDALQVWEYCGGPWKLAQALPFGAAPPQA